MILNSGTNSLQKILFATFKDKFYPTITECLVDSYRLVVKGTGSSYSLYSGSNIYMDSSYNIWIDTSSVTSSLTLYIEASNPTAIGYAYLPFYVTVANFAPYFVDGPPADQLVEYDYKLPDETSSFTYTIPPYIDNEEAIVSISVSKLQDFMVFNEIDNTIELQGIGPEIVGHYTVKIALQDSQGLVASYTVKFEVMTINEEATEVKKTTGTGVSSVISVPTFEVD
jgi:hypothetical protein